MNEAVIVHTLALLALAAFLTLAIFRIRDGGPRRYLFLDLLLVLAALEVVADTLEHFDPAWHIVAWLTRGGLTAGGFGLLLTYRHRRHSR